MKTLQMVMTTWKNTGDTSIRVIVAKFTFRDGKKQIIQDVNYTLYAASDAENGVAPGETYSTRKGEGFVFPDPDKKASSVEVTITKVAEKSGI